MQSNPNIEVHLKMDAAEQDVFSEWRDVHTWADRPGATASVKRQYRRRTRQAAREFLRTYDAYAEGEDLA